VQTALRLQPNAGEVHLALANYYYFGFLTTPGPQRAGCRQTNTANNPDVFVYIGFIDRRQGRWLEAAGNLERVLS